MQMRLRPDRRLIAGHEGRQPPLQYVPGDQWGRIHNLCAGATRGHLCSRGPHYRPFIGRSRLRGPGQQHGHGDFVAMAVLVRAQELGNRGPDFGLGFGRLRL